MTVPPFLVFPELQSLGDVPHLAKMPVPLVPLALALPPPPPLSLLLHAQRER